jgi:hypothetical protein
VFSQQRPIATVRLTAAAPAGNASISIESSNPDVAKVPSSNISIAAGETSNTFTIDTATVRTSTTVNIEARYLNVTMRATLTVLPPPLNAAFTIRSASRGDDACAIVNSVGAVDCLFDASRSTGIISAYRWTLTIAGKDLSLTMAEGQAAFVPATDCSFLGGGNLSSDGTESIRVVLRLEDREGNTTSPLQKTVKLYPNSMCGYP